MTEVPGFLAHWLNWAKTGKPTDGGYDPGLGLCYNLDVYAREAGIDEDDLYDDLIEMFRADGLDESYPFGGKDVYIKEADEDTMNLNLLRLAWVRSKLAD